MKADAQCIIHVKDKSVKLLEIARFEKLNKVGPDKSLNHEEIPRIITIFGSFFKKKLKQAVTNHFHAAAKINMWYVHKITTRVSSIRKSQALLLKMFKL